MSEYKTFSSKYKIFSDKYNNEAKKGGNVVLDKRLWIAINFLEDQGVKPGEIEKLQAVCDELLKNNEVEMLEIIKYFLELLSKE